MIRVGIQGTSGSSNERAAKHFATVHSWTAYQIVPLINTAPVLKALRDQSIDFGTFAWESSRGGLVAETQIAIENHSYTKLDEVILEMDHVLLSRENIDPRQTITVFSHPQALKEHRRFVEEKFGSVVLEEERDTAFAAQRLRSGEYPANSLVIAPKSCAEIYGLSIYLNELPSNQGYWTKFFLVSK